MGPSGVISPEESVVYRAVIEAALARGIPFAVGGAFGYACYTGQWRSTKDLDLYVVPSHRDALIHVLTEAGLRDYYDQLPYDRKWIFRSFTNGIIVDVIWAMANHRSTVSDSWIAGGREFQLEGKTVRALTPEKLLWSKLYIIQRDRCDWPDLMNLIHAEGERLDWAGILQDPDEDVPLLRAALSVFAWLAPGRARALPSWLWNRVGLPEPVLKGPPINRTHVRYLDSRPWFATSEEL